MRCTFVVLLLVLGTFLLGDHSGWAQAAPGAGELPLRLTPAKRLSGKESKVGDPVDFRVVGDVKDATDAVVVPDGSRVQGYVVEAHGPGGFGHAGALKIACAFIELSDGRHVPTRFDLETKGISDRFSAELVALPVANVAVVGVIVAGLLGPYYSSVSAVLYLATVPVYVAVKVYHFIGNLFHGTDAVTKPGDVYAGFVAWPVVAAAS